MVRQFKNRVRIADVQAEFDNLCERIDNLNQRIQDVTDIGEEYDYSVGSDQLASAGYTLTVGGLKKALAAFDGMVIGAKAFRVNSNTVRLTAGLLITSQGCFNIPSGAITIPPTVYSIYFDTTINTITTSPTDYKICDINLNRGSINATDNKSVQCENIYGTYNISIPSRVFPNKGNSDKGYGAFTGWLDWGNLSNTLKCYEAVDVTSAPKFVVPVCCCEADDGDRYEVYYLNQRIAYRKGLHRWCNWQSPMNYILLPKGVSNPFNYKLQRAGWNLNSYDVRTTNPTKCSAQKQYNVKISKKIKQKTS